MAAASFAGFLPAIGISISFWPTDAFFGFLAGFFGVAASRLALPTIEVCAISGPRPSDRRGRYSYWPDERAERREIETMFARDLHFLGCWHTHPEDMASPSHVDTQNISDCVRRSEHALNGFLMVIVGRAPLPENLFVSVCDLTTVHRLEQSGSTT